MKNLNMIIEGENGQLMIDFEALEIITSSDFVEMLKKDIAHFEVRSFLVDDFKGTISVLVFYGGSLRQYCYFKSDGHFLLLQEFSSYDAKLLFRAAGYEIEKVYKGGDC